MEGFTKAHSGRPGRKRCIPLKRLLIAGFFLGLIVSASPPAAMAAPDGETDSAVAKKPLKGIRIDHVDRDASESVAWIRIRVISDTSLPETWSVLENVEQWEEFMDLYSKVERVSMDGPLDRYVFFVSPPWPLPKAQTVVRLMKNQKDHVLDYWIEQGFMAGTYGTVSVGENNGGSRILFENLGPPNQRFPDWMVKMGVYLVVPAVLKEIRERVREIKEEAQDHPAVDTQAPIQPFHPQSPGKPASDR